MTSYVGISANRCLGLMVRFGFDSPTTNCYLGLCLLVFPLQTKRMEATQAQQYAEHGYVVIRNVLPTPAMDIYANYTLMQQNHPGYLHPEEITKSLDRHVDVLGESLLQQLQPLIEEASGKKLYPAYSWLRIYKNGSDLPKHIDRRSCEISASMTLGFDSDSPWPLFVESQGESIPLDLPPGDLVVYAGSVVPHWREPFTGKYWIQVFLHYVDTQGEFTRYRFDGRPGIGHPSVKRK